MSDKKFHKIKIHVQTFDVNRFDRNGMLIGNQVIASPSQPKPAQQPVKSPQPKITPQQLQRSQLIQDRENYMSIVDQIIKEQGGE
ncbi:hypothetical protein TVAG_376530 [Trichomonas vaginalis G3]|uniref:Uncharacterized protein n=1 Tax=Trichomonas vaginalis (strain ATCC PRA-98 / G3) TaxID=412133 RepID=A2FU80_TRIV3|nr:hypothetical protein TVAGG3_0705880 [Trichomonas vaginalis G3]EAX91541.1 hypothetical protein TVAG_376530 [Trichomonas vaginalis G3]KAI5509566.1 hypothetical protein TVAGG3_0705880 [Trichomonas vaginalis G3]|eukprot:XP_001304471.1 hypothetical protein [Trichomonas vaginalis G3]